MQAEKEEFKMTPEELATFNEACKSSEFKELFFSYLKELEDPANKKLYEEEIQKLELEKGNIVEFVKPVFVKAFLFEKYAINVCKGNVKEYELNELKYKIPFCLNIVKKEIIEGKEYDTYSISFHENTIRDLDYFSIAKDEIENIIKAKLIFVKECEQVGQIENSITKTSTKKSNKMETSLEFIEKTLKEQQKKKLEKKDQKTKKDVIPEFKLTYMQIHDGYQAYAPAKIPRNTHLKISISLNIESINNIDLDFDEDGLRLRGCGYVLTLKFNEDLDYDNAEAVFVKSSKLLTITVKILYPLQKADVFEDLKNIEERENNEEKFLESAAEIEFVSKIEEIVEDNNGISSVIEIKKDAQHALDADITSKPINEVAEEFDPTITINEISDDKADLQSQEATTEVAEQGDRTKTFNEINYKIEQQTLEAPIEAAGDGMDAVDKMTKDVERVVLDADLTPTTEEIGQYIPIVKTSQTLKTATIVVETPKIIAETFTHTNSKILLLNYKTFQHERSISLEINEEYTYEIDVGEQNVVIRFVKSSDKYWDTFLVNGKAFGFMVLRDQEPKLCTGKVKEKIFVKNDAIKVQVTVDGEKVDPEGKVSKNTIFVNDLLFDLD